MSKRPNSSSDNTPAVAKRPRSNPSEGQDEPPPCPYPRLEAARFPPEVVAIPHVLKQIDVFLMTREEALVEAAKTGDAAWLCGLVEDADDDSVVRATVEASGHGHVECVEILMEECAVSRNVLTGYRNWQALLNAVVAAATSCHLDVLVVLLPKLRLGPDKWRESDLACTVCRAMIVAAKGGHLDMVKFLVHFSINNGSEGDRYGGSALAHAISSGQTVVVEYLLSLNGFRWDLEGAFVAAVDAGDNSLADKIYQRYLQKAKKKKKLFTSLSCHGHLKALKYLYETGLNDDDLIEEAFVSTASRHGTVTLDFLLGTGKISSEAFDSGFKEAVDSLWDRLNIVPFLLDTQRVSAKLINEAFVTARCTRSDFLTMLLERGCIWEESIRAVFNQATRGLSEYDSKRESENARIIQLLYTKECISAEMIGKAFVTAASNGHSKLVTLLRADGRVSAKMVDEAFVRGATRDKSDIVMSLSDADISPNVILVAFSRAAAQGCVRSVKELVNLLSDEDRVPPEFKHKAFVVAAQLKHDTVLQILCESGGGSWPLATLKEALAVAEHSEVKNFIREVTCDQLFDPSCPWIR